MATESKRQQRFAGVIQKDLAEILQRDSNAWAPGAFITITKVRVTTDLSIASVFLSFINTEKRNKIWKKSNPNRVNQI